MSIASTYGRAAGLGAVAGLRSMSAPALVSHYAATDKETGLEKTPLASPTVSKVLWVAAAGELIADKLPGMPDRTSPPSLAIRAASGGIAGAAIFVAEDRPGTVGALVGALSAMAAAYAGLHLRRWAGRRLGVPDQIIATAEDALVIGGGSRILQLK